MNKYLAYLRDNPNQYWFKRKVYGWGWVPATAEGWTTLLVFVGLLIGDFLRIDAASHSASDTLLNFLPQAFFLSCILIAICWQTGESPRWQWGIPAKEE